MESECRGDRDCRKINCLRNCWNTSCEDWVPGLKELHEYRIVTAKKSKIPKVSSLNDWLQWQWYWEKKYNKENHFSREEKFDFRHVEASSPWDRQVKMQNKGSIDDNSLRRHAQIGNSWRHYSKWKWKEKQKNNNMNKEKA